MSSMIDREKVVAVLIKRFPAAPLNDVAAAANAIVGLELEYAPVLAADVARLECEVGSHLYSVRHLGNGDLRLFVRNRGRPN